MLVMATLQIKHTQKPKWKLALQLFMKMPAPVREDVCAHNINIYVSTHVCTYFVVYFFYRDSIRFIVVGVLIAAAAGGDDGFSTNDIFCWTLFPLFPLIFYSLIFIRVVSYFYSNQYKSLVLMCHSYAMVYGLRYVCWYIYKIYLLDNVVHPLNFRITLDDQCLPRHISNYSCH